MLPITIMILGMVVIFIINSLFMKRNQLQVRARRIDVLLGCFTTLLREELKAHQGDVALDPELQELLSEQLTAPTPRGCQALNALLKSRAEFATTAQAIAPQIKELAAECQLYDKQVLEFNRAIANPPGLWFKGMLKLTPFQSSSDK